VRAALAAGAAVVTLAVAATRLYLGAQWLTDVLAGLLLAGSALLLGSAFLAPVYSTHSRPDWPMMKSTQPRRGS
jgi:undecaprenyl-diphosphatase